MPQVLRHSLWWLLCSGWLTIAAAQSASALLSLKVGNSRLTVEVARTPQQLQQGLMQRPWLAADAGMLFIFPPETAACMWMKNTLLPLSVAFIDQQGTILNIAEMQAHSEAIHCAIAPARYAVEANAGWFANNQVRAGHQVQGLPPAP